MTVHLIRAYVRLSESTFVSTSLQQKTRFYVLSKERQVFVYCMASPPDLSPCPGCCKSQHSQHRDIVPAGWRVSWILSPWESCGSEREWAQVPPATRGNDWSHWAYLRGDPLAGKQNESIEYHLTITVLLKLRCRVFELRPRSTTSMQQNWLLHWGSAWQININGKLQLHWYWTYQNVTRQIFSPKIRFLIVVFSHSALG